MNDLQIFKSADFGEVRTVEFNGEPWFVASDVCRVLDIQNATQTVFRLDEDERSMFNIGRQGDAHIVNETGLYSLVLGSRKPEAKAFKRWITHEVIPSIRKHGAYMTPATIDQMITDPSFGIKLLTALQDEQAKRKALEVETEHKQAVIEGFTKDISLDKKREILNRVMRKGFGNAEQQRSRWNALYEHFENVMHVNVSVRIGKWEDRMCKPWKESKLAFIDKQMEMLPELYEIAVKLYETDVEKVKKELFAS